ncbi:MAG: ABC transporter permease [Prolixibacteraceae bacterium]|nr:ABC transporter permease [Prolixibacteraceae bacterium]
MIWSIAWKNVWRNRKRSLVVIGAVTLGTIAGVFTAGMMKGWVNQRIESIVYTEISHVKIHQPEYLLNNEINYTIPNIDQIDRYVENQPNIIGYSKRLKLMAMAQTSGGNTALMLQGIQLNEEKNVCRVHQQLVENGGTFFDTNMSNPIVISDKTAEQLRIKNYKIEPETLDSLKILGVPDKIIRKLKTIENERFITEKLFKKAITSTLSKKGIKKYGSLIVETSKHYRLNSKIILTFNDIDGELIYQTYKVCGIFKTANTMFDQMTAYVLRDDLSAITGFGRTDFHEIAMIVNEETDPGQIRNEMREKFSGLSIMSWKDISPEAAMMTSFMDIWYLVIMGIILLALAFGIINTMLMAILERVKELGMLMAIGMNKKRVFRMIMLETIFLTMVGAVIGMVLGGILIAVTKHTGINFSSVGEGLEAMGWSAMVYPDIDFDFFLLVTAMVIVTGILSSITPARKALKLNPVEAIRTE